MFPHSPLPYHETIHSLPRTLHFIRLVSISQKPSFLMQLFCIAKGAFHLKEIFARNIHFAKGYFCSKEQAYSKCIKETIMIHSETRMDKNLFETIVVDDRYVMTKLICKQRTLGSSSENGRPYRGVV